MRLPRSARWLPIALMCSTSMIGLFLQIFDARFSHATPVDSGRAVIGNPLEIDAMQWTERHRAYWRGNLKITGLLLAIWFVVTFVLGFFARDLNFTFFGWPFSFWVGAQGAPLVYVILVAYYAHHMEKLDREHGVAEDDNDAR